MHTWWNEDDDGGKREEISLLLTWFLEKLELVCLTKKVSGSARTANELWSDCLPFYKLYRYLNI